MTLTKSDIERMQAEDDEAAEDDETPPEPEPEPEPEPPVGEKAMKAMEREATRHTGAVAKIMGDAFPAFQVCPLCDVFPAGFVPHFDDVPDEMAAELVAHLAAYFESPDRIEPPYREARTMTRCSDCDGWGQVKSGAQTPLHRLEQCPACTGNGYVPRVQTQPVPLYGGPAPTPTPASSPAQLPYLDVHGNACAVPPDPLGRFFGDPAYGQPGEPGAA